MQLDGRVSGGLLSHRSILQVNGCPTDVALKSNLLPNFLHSTKLPIALIDAIINI
jgi:hypothetical protein